jgi:hypothetical protein
LAAGKISSGTWRAETKEIELERTLQRGNENGPGKIQAPDMNGDTEDSQ